MRLGSAAARFIFLFSPIIMLRVHAQIWNACETVTVFSVKFIRTTSVGVCGALWWSRKACWMHLVALFHRLLCLSLNFVRFFHLKLITTILFLNFYFLDLNFEFVSFSVTQFSFSILFLSCVSRFSLFRCFQHVEKARRPRNCCCHCCCCSNWRRPPFCHWCSASWHWLHSRHWLSVNWLSCCPASSVWRNCSNRRIHRKTTKLLPIHTVHSMNMATMDDPSTMHTTSPTLHTNSKWFLFCFLVRPLTSIEFTN